MDSYRTAPFGTQLAAMNVSFVALTGISSSSIDVERLTCVGDPVQLDLVLNRRNTKAGALSKALFNPLPGFARCS